MTTSTRNRVGVGAAAQTSFRTPAAEAPCRSQRSACQCNFLLRPSITAVGVWHRVTESHWRDQTRHSLCSGARTRSTGTPRSISCGFYRLPSCHLPRAGRGNDGNVAPRSSTLHPTIPHRNCITQKALNFPGGSPVTQSQF